eukprot:349738-Chlamydomonas_euryale.AAC.2
MTSMTASGTSTAAYALEGVLWNSSTLMWCAEPFSSANELVPSAVDAAVGPSERPAASRASFDSWAFETCRARHSGHTAAASRRRADGNSGLCNSQQ